MSRPPTAAARTLTLPLPELSSPMFDHEMASWDRFRSQHDPEADAHCPLNPRHLDKDDLQQPPISIQPRLWGRIYLTTPATGTPAAILHPLLPLHERGRSR